MTKEQKMTYLIEMALERLNNAMFDADKSDALKDLKFEHRSAYKLGIVSVIIKEAVHYLELAKQQHDTEAKSS